MTENGSSPIHLPLHAVSSDVGAYNYSKKLKDAGYPGRANRIYHYQQCLYDLIVPTQVCIDREGDRMELWAQINGKDERYKNFLPHIVF